ncbi:ABC-F family ATP-binding cassette domain-containing protein [Acidipropionibacterium jensenii]|uniref:ABC-F family ATP-binding cassette domain-containing protein n=1 Tax=Acidipropionibacterium jensenii TaxID=1749 RepID=UPI00214C882D|nr:ATP-binding cassette domain-containing protein [Acidipropionibacterium jensenii]
MSSHPSVVIDHLTFAWPDGTPVVTDLNCTVPVGRTGLIGDNGTGKTTLLRLIAGDLEPASGHISVTGSIAMLSQDVARRADLTVSDLLGISTVRTALRAVEAGSVDPADFTAIGDNWDIEPRALAELSGLGLGSEESLLDRPVTSLSGGEATMVAIAGLGLVGSGPAGRGQPGAGVTLLDEPTNNLDAGSRCRLYDQLDDWPGSVLVVSHDRELLEHVDTIIELDPTSPTGTRTFTGSLSDYQLQRQAEQQVAGQRLREADAQLRRIRRQAAADQQHLAQRDRVGRSDAARSGMGKGAEHYFVNRSQRSAASGAQRREKQASEAAVARDRADAAARLPDRIRVDLPSTGLPESRQVLELMSGDHSLRMDGPERIRIAGPNGVGKSTLVQIALGERSGGALGQGADAQLESRALALFAEPLNAVRTPQVPVGLIGQRDDLDSFATPLDAVRDACPDATPNQARALLARMLVGATMASRPIGVLSGGERFRVALARMLFAEPAPQLLILDEPTNNLDISSTDHLVEALDGYRGALMIISHDNTLVGRLRVDRVWQLSDSPEGTVIEDRPVSRSRAQ